MTAPSVARRLETFPGQKSNCPVSSENSGLPVLVGGPPTCLPLQERLWLSKAVELQSSYMEFRDLFSLKRD